MKHFPSSINIPVKLMGDYMQFKGHSGLSFPDVGEDTYYIHHSDNIAVANYFNGLKNTTRYIEGGE